ncbi:MAG: alpha/beta fold hydrolase, partial [Micromonosporaceae bacterium]
VSYGTFVAQRYALTYPRRADRLVLDSVVTQDNADPLYVPAMARSAWVLRKACQEQSCPSDDPAEDLAVTLRRHGDGVRALDALIILSIIDPKLTSPDFAVLDRLRQAAAGNPAPWQELLGWFSPGDSTPKEEFSAGLHLATLCPDFTDLPWGDSSAPMRGRDQAVRRAVATLPPGSVWPFQPRTAGEQGFIANCKQWPPTRPNPAPPHHRLTMPVLLLAGDRDLSTPLQWAEDQLARTPRGELVVIKGAGHSVQRRSPAGALAVTDFLLH